MDTKTLAAAMGYTDKQVKNVQAGGVSDSYIQEQITNNPTVASKVTMEEVNTQVNELLDENDRMSWKSKLQMTPKFCDSQVRKSTSMKTIVDYKNFAITGGNTMLKIDMTCEYLPVQTGLLRPWSTVSPKATRNVYQFAKYKDYIYAVVRAGSGTFENSGHELNDNESDGAVGYLLIIEPNEFKVVSEIRYIYQDEQGDIEYTTTTDDDGVIHISCTRKAKPTAIVIDEATNIMYIGYQLYGFALFDLSNPLKPTVIYDHYEDATVLNSAKIKEEYQHGCFFRNSNDVLHLAVAGYEDGIHLFNLSDISNPIEIINDSEYKVAYHNEYANTHVFDVVANYPYLYCTIAPTSSHANDADRTCGIITLDITDVSNINHKLSPIDSDDYCTYTGNDALPSELIIANSKILANNGNKGIAVWTLEDFSNPTYRGCIPNVGLQQTKGMIYTEDGRLISGNQTGDGNIKVHRGI